MNPKLLAIDMMAASSANVHPALAESSSNSKQKRPSALASDDISSQSSPTKNQITKFNKTLLSVQSYSAQSPDGSNYTLSEDPPQEQMDPKPPSESTPLIDAFSDPKLPTASLPPGSDITKPAVSMPDTAKTENKPLMTGIDLAQTTAAAPIISAGSVELPEAAMLSTLNKADVPVLKSPMPPTSAVSSNQETSFSVPDKLTGDKDATNPIGQDKVKLEANLSGFIPISLGNPAKVETLTQLQLQTEPSPTLAPLVNISSDPGLQAAFLSARSDIIKPAVSMPDTAKAEDEPLITGIDLAQTKAAASVIEANSIKATSVQKSPMPPYAANSNGPKIPTIDSDLPITQLSSSQQTQAVSSNQETSFSAPDKLTGDKAAANNKDKIIPELTDGNAGKNVGVLSSDFLSYKTTVAESQILTRQPKSQNSSVANDNFNANFEQIFSHNAAQIAVAQKSSVLAETDKPVNNFYFSDVSSDVAKQILESIYSSFSTDPKQITIRLNPPELGKVLIRFRQEDTSIIGLLEVDKTQTKYQIEQALPQIIQNLQDSGIQIKRLEVMLAQQNQQDHLPDQSTHQDCFQQRSFPGYDTSDSGKSVNLFLTNPANSQDNPTYPVQVTGDSINILV